MSALLSPADLYASVAPVISDDTVSPAEFAWWLRMINVTADASDARRITRRSGALTSASYGVFRTDGYSFERYDNVTFRYVPADVPIYAV